MSKVSMLQSGVRAFANAVKKTAIKDKKFAEELVYMHGIKSEITPKALRGITKDMFDKGGKLTEKGKNEVTRLIKELNLPENATWEEALGALRRYKENLPKIEIPQLPKFDFKKITDKFKM